MCVFYVLWETWFNLSCDCECCVYELQFAKCSLKVFMQIILLTSPFFNFQASQSLFIYFCFKFDSISLNVDLPTRLQPGAGEQFGVLPFHNGSRSLGI